MPWLPLGFPGGTVVKNLLANVGVTGLVPGTGRFPGIGNGNPLHYSCLKNPVDRGAWWVPVHGIAKHRTLLNVRVCAHTRTHTRD